MEKFKIIDLTDIESANLEYEQLQSIAIVTNRIALSETKILVFYVAR